MSVRRPSTPDPVADLAAEKPPATRRRGHALEQAIYEAVFAQLRDVGYERLTMDGVAAEARTGKAPLYRRWPDKEALIADALRNALPDPAALLLTDDLRTDLIMVLEFLRTACVLTADTAFRVAKGGFGPDAKILHATVRERVSEPSRQLTLEILRRAAARGEVAPEAATMLVAKTGPALLIYHNLTEGELPADLPARIVDEAVLPGLRGARHIG